MAFKPGTWGEEADRPRFGGRQKKLLGRHRGTPEAAFLVVIEEYQDFLEDVYINCLWQLIW